VNSLPNPCRRIGKAITVVLLHNQSAACLANGLRAVLLLSALIAPGCAVSAQTANQPKDAALMRQLHQALTLDEHGDRQGAMALTLQLLTQSPKFAPAIKLKGMLLEEAGQSAEAEAAYEEALKIAPNDPDLLFKTGISKLHAGDRDQAIKLLEHCTRLSPGDGEAQFYLAQAYHLNGQDKLALAAIRQSLKAEPDNPPVWQKYGELLCSTGDCEGGLKWLLQAQHSNPSLPMIDYDIAWTDFKLMDVASAAPYAARAVATQPNDVPSLELLATTNVKLAHWQEAETAFQRILSLHSENLEASLGLGHCELELKDYPAAVETLNAVLRADPTRLLAHFYLSRAYAAMGREAEAQHEAALHQLMMEQLTFSHTVQSDELESPIKDHSYQLLTEHHEQEALQLYREHFKGAAATPADAYVFVGKLYLMGGDEEDGLRCLQHALQIQPTVHEAHTYQGILALKQGDLNRAESEFKAELANDPNSQMAIAEIGEVRYHQSRWADAAEQLAKSKTMTPELLYMLCDSYFHMGKVTDADLTAEVAAAYARNNPAFLQGLADLLTRNGEAELAKRVGANLPPPKAAN
jgi:tetratricopeptide (TPR) repeat protein